MWIAKERAVINPTNNYEQYFNWAPIAALHCEGVGKDLNT